MYEDVVDEYRKERLIRKQLKRYKTHSRYVVNDKENGRFEQIWDILDIQKGTFIFDGNEEIPNRGMLTRALNKEYRDYNETIMTYLNLQHG